MTFILVLLWSASRRGLIHIMHSRFQLMNSGLYPETLPPCFVSKDAKRAFVGLVKSLDMNRFHERKTEFVRYNGTKHDGSRRFFGTPNIITYFHISSFIWRNWTEFESNYALSKFSIGNDVTPNFHPVLIRASALLLPMRAYEARGCVA